MRRVGGVFVCTFLAVCAVQAVTGFVPVAPSAADMASSSESVEKEGVRFTGNGNPVRKGSVPEQEWEDLINTWGNLCKSLTPSILAGQLYQESGFDPEVVSGKRNSSAGARGISQFIPSTWQAHGIDGNGDGERNILDPRDAIPSAATYDCTVAGYVKNVPGDATENMLASYNAGSNAVKKYQGIPPYEETKNYVRLIKKYAAERFEQQ